MYGLSGIDLDQVSVTRNENLTDFRAKVVFAFDHLEINGTYSLKATVGSWTLDSKVNIIGGTRRSELIP